MLGWALHPSLGDTRDVSPLALMLCSSAVLSVASNEGHGQLSHSHNPRASSPVCQKMREGKENVSLHQHHQPTGKRQGQLSHSLDWLVHNSSYPVSSTVLPK